MLPGHSFAQVPTLSEGTAAQDSRPVHRLDALSQIMLVYGGCDVCVCVFVRVRACVFVHFLVCSRIHEPSRSPSLPPSHPRTFVALQFVHGKSPTSTL